MHWWLWKLWNLFTCSKSNFYDKEADTDNKTDKTRIFFAKKLVFTTTQKIQFSMLDKYLRQPQTAKPEFGPKI